MTRSFVLLATQRTGSTVVWQTLDGHPALFARGEMFLRDMQHPDSYPSQLRRKDRRLLAPGWSVHHYLDAFHRERVGIDAASFMLMYSQLRPEIWTWLGAHDADVLHLVRRNPVEILVSKAAAETTGLCHPRPGQTHEARPVALDVASLAASLDRITARVEAHRARIAGLRHLEIRYKEHLDQPQAFFDRCFAFLAVEPQPVELPLHKLTRDLLRDAVTSYDEVAAVLEGMPHAALLEAS